MATTDAGMSHAPRYRLFGSFRLLLALFVLVGHGAGLLLPHTTFVLQLQFGNAAVFSFFVLSGFVISEALEGFYPGQPQRFLANRLLKIVPGYWAALLFTIVVWLAIGHPDLAKLTPNNLLGSVLLFGGDLRISNFYPITIVWSLIIEMEFYIVAAILYALITRFGGRGWWLSIAALIGLAGQLWVIETGNYFRFYGPLFFAPFFLLGAGIYHLERGLLPRGPTLVVTLAALLASGYGYLIYISRGAIDPAGSMAVMTAVFALLLILVPMRAGALQRWDARLGAVTYLVYLLHMAFIDAIKLPLTGNIEQPLPTMSAGVAGIAVAVVATLATASLLHRLVEIPLARRRARIRGTDLGA